MPTVLLFFISSLSPRMFPLVVPVCFSTLLWTCIFSLACCTAETDEKSRKQELFEFPARGVALAERGVVVIGVATVGRIFIICVRGDMFYLQSRFLIRSKMCWKCHIQGCTGGPRRVGHFFPGGCRKPWCVGEMAFTLVPGFSGTIAGIMLSAVRCGFEAPLRPRRYSQRWLR